MFPIPQQGYALEYGIYLTINFLLFAFQSYVATYLLHKSNILLAYEFSMRHDGLSANELEA